MQTQFTATTTKVQIDPAPPRWRKLDFAMLIGASCLAGWKALGGRVRPMPRHAGWAAPLLLTGANRRFITLGCLRLGFYPVRGYLGRRCPEWDRFEQVRITTTDGNEIGGRLLKSPQSNGKVILIHSGNFFCYEWVHPQLFDSFLKEGCDVMLFHSPGHGSSTGSRWMQSDLYGIDAVMQFLLHKGYRENQITVIGTSIGTGGSCEVAKNYNLDHLHLVVPFNDLNDVIARWLPRPISWLTRRDVSEYFAYNNAEKIKERANVTVLEAKEDALMSAGNGPTEAKRLNKSTHSLAGHGHELAIAGFNYNAVFRQNFSEVKFALNLLGVKATSPYESR